MKTKTQVINLLGGPGVGKSTIAAGIFSNLKKARVSCELVTEVAKEITYEETGKLLENQIYIFSEQYRRQWRLIDKVHYIITDSPLILNSVYYDYYLEKLGYGSTASEVKFSADYIELSRLFFDKTFQEFNNRNIFVRRYYEFDDEDCMIYPTWEKEGRNQTLSEALDLDDKIQSKLASSDPYFESTPSLSDTGTIIDSISDFLISEHKNNQQQKKGVVNDRSLSTVYTQESLCSLSSRQKATRKLE